MKKFLKIIGVVLLILLGILIAVPFVLEAKIGELIRTNVNSNVNAKLDFAEASLSLIKSFPNAELGLQNVTLINNAPFEGDTLFAAKDVSLTLGMSELFKSEKEAIGIKNLSIDGANIHVKVNESEIANYDIGKDDGTAETNTEESSDGFTLDLQSYELTNSNIIYDDQAGKILFILSDIQHSGTGDLSASISELDTNTEAKVSFAMDSTNYLNNNKIKLDALIGVDLEESKYTFLKNELVLNQLPLVFDGFIKLNENSQDIDISFKAPSSDFKNFLAVIPETYAQNIADVKTTGNFSIEGKFEGTVDEDHIPKFDIKINSDNASFKYPDLPKAVSKVFIDTKIINTTGITEDTFVDIDRISFNIDNDRFNMMAKIKELMGNTKVNGHVDGKMNLANIAKACPTPEGADLKGILSADITTAFDMASIEKSEYKNTQTTGSFNLSDFEYVSEETPNPVKIQSTALTFNQKTVTLNKLNGTTGQTDFNATGTINNLLGFMFNDEKIEGNFDLKSDTFALNDFMVTEEETTPGTTGDGEKTDTPPEEKIKIPSFLDANINASANTVLYDNLTLKDVKGNLRIKDEKATLTNMTSSIFNGKMGFNGQVSTKGEEFSFGMKLDMNSLNISETFKSLELFETIAPIAGMLRGTLDSEVEISGKLNDDFTPNLASISGDILAELLQADLDPKKAAFLNTIGEKLSFLKPENLNLKGLKTALTFEDGQVKVKPFTVNYNDVAINIAGGHSFDQNLNYKATMEVPAKYLGNEVKGLMAKIGEDDLKDLTIPVSANIGGAFSSPQVSTDITSGVKGLTSQLVEIQKQKLVNTGKDKAKDLLSGVLGGNTDEKDAAKTEESTEDQAKDILGGILGGTKKNATPTKTDSVAPKKTEDEVKDKAKDILGGFLGRKKKKDSTN